MWFHSGFIPVLNLLIQYDVFGTFVEKFPVQRNPVSIGIFIIRKCVEMIRCWIQKKVLHKRDTFQVEKTRNRSGKAEWKKLEKLLSYEITNKENERNICLTWIIWTTESSWTIFGSMFFAYSTSTWDSIFSYFFFHKFCARIRFAYTIDCVLLIHNTKICWTYIYLFSSSFFFDE